MMEEVPGRAVRSNTYRSCHSRGDQSHNGDGDARELHDDVSESSS